MTDQYVRVPLGVLLDFEKSGVNQHQGWSEKCCPVCRRGAYDIAADKAQSKPNADAYHATDCWVGKAIIDHDYGWIARQPDQFTDDEIAAMSRPGPIVFSKLPPMVKD